MLLILGGSPATQPYVIASQIFSIAYFAYFLIVLAILPFIETYLLQYFNYRIKRPRAFRKRTKRPIDVTPFFITPFQKRKKRTKKEYL